MGIFSKLFGTGGAHTQRVILEKELHSKIVGVSFKNDDGTRRQKIIEDKCYVGDKLQFVHQPNNPHGSNVVAVFHVKSKLQLGHLESRLATDMVRQFEKNKIFAVEISDITGSDEDRYYGVNIRIRICRQDNQ